MKNNFRKLISFVLAGVIAGGMAFPALAASKKAAETRAPISAVTVNVKSYIEHEDDTGHIEVTTADSQYSVGNTDWGTVPSGGWKVGDEPKVKIYLHARNGYYFDKNVSNKKIVVNGATASGVKKENNDETVVITVKLNRVSGTLDEPDNAEWVGYPIGRASWGKVSNASAYELKLYRDDQQVYSVERCVGNTFDFYPYMRERGSYSFRVRSVPVSSEETAYITASDWAYSDTEYISEDETAESVYHGDRSDGNPVKNPSDVGWVKDGDGWRCRYAYGSLAKSKWELIHNKWYYFDYDGYMLTGWQEINGHRYYLSDSGDLQSGWLMYDRLWYYLNPSNGVMVTGWAQADGNWYYLDPGNGVMKVGWVLTEEKWYYLDPDNGGAMSKNKRVGDFYVNLDGVWIP